MNSRYILILLAFSAMGCGKEKKIEAAFINPAFASQVKAFEAASAEVGVAVAVDDITIDFGAGNGSTTTLAVCVTPQKSEDDEDEEVVRRKRIEVNPARWDSLSDAQKEALIIHELGHCKLGAGHTPDLSGDGKPMSIMYPYLVSGQTYTEYKYWYVARLVNGDWTVYEGPEPVATP